MRHLIGAALVIAAIAVPTALASETPSGGSHPDPYPASCDGKPVSFHLSRAKAVIDVGYAKSRWEDQTPLRGSERAALKEHKQCILIPNTRRQIEQYRDEAAAKFQKARKYKVQVAKYTPYDCGSAGHWAIPCAIVACESGYSWSASNPSGAVGPYQLLGWGAPYPVASRADKLEHHKIAYNLYAGGAGRSNWVC